MRAAVFWLLAVAVVAAAETGEEPWVEEEDLDEPYNEEPDTHERTRREAYVEAPYEDHIRVKRRCSRCGYEPEYKVRRSPDYRRVPRQVHQYEVHESTDEGTFPSPPFEEMLAASAEHYHRVYSAPGAPASARYLHDVSARAPSLSVPPAQFVQPAYVSVAPASVSHNHNHNPVQFVRFPESITRDSAAINHHNPVFVDAPVPIPVSDPVAIAQAPIVGPAAVASEPVTSPAQQLSGDQFVAAAGHHHHKQQGHAASGGHKKHAGHHGAHGGKSIKGFDSHQHLDKGGKGHKTDEHHRKEYEEALGKKRKHHDHADHKGGHVEEAHGQKGAHFDEKKGHKKGHKTKGYHNKYHKDEFHKEHKFYDDFHKSGEHHRFGKFHAKHASNESGKKKAHHVNAGHDVVQRGKKGYSNKGHVDADHKGYNGKHGNEEHHENHSDHGKKEASEGGKKWGYGKKN